MRQLPIALAAALLCSFAAFASIGHVATLEGTATRAPANGPPVPLKQGDAVEMGDTVTVSPDGDLELELSDESTLEVKGGSKLHIDKAHFEDLERHFSLHLLVGAVWAAVSHLGKGSSFEITTSRAVAGVRGTIFRVDVDGTGADAQTTVEVQEGKVAVTRAGVVSASSAGQPQMLTQGQALRVDHAGWRRIAHLVRAGRFARFIARHRARALQRRAEHLRKYRRFERRLRREQWRRRKRHGRWRRWKRLHR